MQLDASRFEGDWQAANPKDVLQHVVNEKQAAVFDFWRFCPRTLCWEGACAGHTHLKHHHPC